MDISSRIRICDDEFCDSSDDVFDVFCHVLKGKGAIFSSRFFRLFLRIFIIFSLLFREFVSFDKLRDWEIHREYVMIDGSGVLDLRFLGPLFDDLEE